MCVCVYVCVYEREREREDVFTARHDPGKVGDSFSVTLGSE
jgi:hypothetical protein